LLVITKIINKFLFDGPILLLAFFFSAKRTVNKTHKPVAARFIAQ